MENIYIIQNGKLSFDMDVSQLYFPDQYTLFFITNHFSFEKLQQRSQEKYFDKIWIMEYFSFELLKEIIQKNQNKNYFSFNIVTNAEESLLVTGELRKYFKIDLVDYDRFVNKILMKKYIGEARLSFPKFITFEPALYRQNPVDYIQHIVNSRSFPMIAKPIDSAACYHVEKLSTLVDLKKWCDQNQLTRSTFEIDEFIQGKVYNCDSYIKNYEIIHTQVSECSNSCYDFLCGFTKGTIALPADDVMTAFFCDYTKQVHEAIGSPRAGVTHLEVILTRDNKPYFVEMAHRSPGILIPAMYRKYLGVGTIEPHILLQINKNYEFNIKHGPYCAWIAFPKKEGVLSKKFIPVIESKFELEWMVEVGEQMEPVQNGRDYAGRLLLWNNDYGQLKKDFNYLNTFTFFEMNCQHKQIIA